MIYVFGDCELDTHLYEFRKAGEPLKLEPKVFDLLVRPMMHDRSLLFLIAEELYSFCQFVMVFCILFDAYLLQVCFA